MVGLPREGCNEGAVHHNCCCRFGGALGTARRLAFESAMVVVVLVVMKVPVLNRGEG